MTVERSRGKIITCCLPESYKMLEGILIESESNGFKHTQGWGRADKSLLFVIINLLIYVFYILASFPCLLPPSATSLLKPLNRAGDVAQLVELTQREQTPGFNSQQHIKLEWWYIPYSQH